MYNHCAWLKNFDVGCGWWYLYTIYIKNMFILLINCTHIQTHTHTNSSIIITQSTFHKVIYFICVFLASLHHWDLNEQVVWSLKISFLNVLFWFLVNYHPTFFIPDLTILRLRYGFRRNKQGPYTQTKLKSRYGHP